MAVASCSGDGGGTGGSGAGSGTVIGSNLGSRDLGAVGMKLTIGNGVHVRDRDPDADRHLQCERDLPRHRGAAAPLRPAPPGYFGTAGGGGGTLKYSHAGVWLPSVLG